MKQKQYSLISIEIFIFETVSKVKSIFIQTIEHYKLFIVDANENLSKTFLLTTYNI